MVDSYNGFLQHVQHPLRACKAVQDRPLPSILSGASGHALRVSDSSALPRITAAPDAYLSELWAGPVAWCSQGAGAVGGEGTNGSD